MKMKKETLKSVLKGAAGIILVAALMVFAFFAIYTDITTPSSDSMTLTTMLEKAAKFKGETLTAEEIEAAHTSAYTLIGAWVAGMLITAVGMLFAAKYPNHKLVRWLLSDYIEENVDSASATDADSGAEARGGVNTNDSMDGSGETVKHDSEGGDGSDCGTCTGAANAVASGEQK